jgi:nitrite reductase/ring-hydroxylating ferredoxin subunit
MKSLLKNSFLISCFCIIFSCKKNTESAIPYVSVNFFIYTSDPDFIDLNAVGGWTYVTGGSRGIIVYRYSNTEFRAYDRHCTYNPSNTCALVSVDVNNIQASDVCCGSVFSIVDGSINNGPASFPLKQYQTSFDGNKLHVYN